MPDNKMSEEERKKQKKLDDLYQKAPVYEGGEERQPIHPDFDFIREYLESLKTKGVPAAPPKKEAPKKETPPVESDREKGFFGPAVPIDSKPPLPPMQGPKYEPFFGPAVPFDEEEARKRRIIEALQDIELERSRR